MGAKPRIGHILIKDHHTGTAVAIQPGAAPLLDILIVGLFLAAEACGLIILIMGIDLGDAEADLALHIHQRSAVGLNDAAAAADGGLLAQRDRCADQVGVGMIAEEAVDDIQRLMAIGALMGAADDNIDVLQRQRRKILVEIEVVAGHKPETDALDLHHVGLAELIGIGAIHLVAPLGDGFDLAGSGMGLKVAANHLAVAVDAMGGVFAFISAVAEDQRIAPLGGLLGLFQNHAVIFLDGGMKALCRALGSGNIGVFGDDDQIHARIALIDQLHHAVKAFFGVLIIKGIPRLHYTYFHFCFLLSCAQRRSANS